MAFYGVREDRNNQTVYREVAEMPTRMQQVFRRGFLEFGRALAKQAKHDVNNGKKTGRVYRNVRLPGGRIKRRHQSSAPGESHANLSRRLRNSISFKVHGHERMEFGYGVATDESNVAPFYASFVEFGTKRMAPRPTLQNAIAKIDPIPHFDRAFDREFTR